MKKVDVSKQENTLSQMVAAAKNSASLKKWNKMYKYSFWM